MIESHDRAGWDSGLDIGVAMVNLDRTISRLRAKREELLAKLTAVDQAIAAVEGAEAGDVTREKDEAHPPVGLMTPGSSVVPTIVKPRRVLADAHKQALLDGRRKARGAKDAAAGRAREMPDASFVSALGTRGGSQAPRLVKK